LAEAVAEASPRSRDKVIAGFMATNRHKFPLVEGNLVTFAYRGKVALGASVPSDLNRWDTKADPLGRLDETDFYYRTLELPADARIDYKLYVDNAWMLDPLNSATVRGGFGDNSAFAMPAYQEPWEIAETKSIEHGTLETHEFQSPALSNTRKVQVYLPAGYSPRGIGGSEIAPCGQTAEGVNTFARFLGSYRSIFVQDGGEYITLGSMARVLDNLIARGAIPPVVAVFIDPVDRNSEYWLNFNYERMVVDELLPFIRDRYDVGRDPAKTAIMGASLGGEISVMIALDHPEVFGKCGSQSGVVGLDQGGLVRAVAVGPKRDVALYLDCGRFGDATDENRRMREALVERGYVFKYQEFNEGHSWGNWRAHLDDMLIFFWGADAAK
jgi:enterochelin esterase family protein